MKSKNQIRHEELIDFLSKFSQYQDNEGNSLIEKVNDSRTTGKISQISTNDINKGVVVLTDFLNINSGSAGEFNLYRLLQAYLSIPEYRTKINSIVDEAHTYDYNRKS